MLLQVLPSSAGESLGLHTEVLTFPFLCFPPLFVFPEQDRLVSYCPVCSHWPPRCPCPTAVSLPMAGCSPLLLGQRKEDSARQVQISDRKRCPHPLSQQCCFVLGEKCSFITWVPGTGRDSRAARNTNTALFLIP